MTIAFYMDEHVPRAITIGLRLRGVDVLTAQEDGRRNTPDADLLDRATALGRVVFTQDDDFLGEARWRRMTGQAFSGVIYVHQMRTTIGACVRDLELVAKAVDLADLENRVEYLPL
jgi:hypothetical protein